jgi:quercetin dioxygenase-like cupin family protein
MIRRHDVPASGFVRPPAALARHALDPGRPLILAATGPDTGDAFGVVEQVIPPGVGPRLHIHHIADELFYILSGTFTFQIGDLQAVGDAGTVAFAPHGVAHTWMNTGNASGRMLFVFSPAGFEQYLVGRSQLPDAARTAEALNALAARYQTTYVGPPLTVLPADG